MDAELKLYNSMFTGELTPSLEEQLVRIYSPLAGDESLVITAVSVQQQSRDRLWFVCNCFCSSRSNEEEFQDNLF